MTHRLLLLLLSLLALGGADALRVNGWYPCAATSPPTDLKWALLFWGVEFECAKIELPLCHPGICESSETTEVFVKRKLASVRPATKTVWFLEGGPGASSTHMELAMVLFSSILDDSITLYTMDHRGTGRSDFLQCEAAQALTDGSPGGANLELSEFADCIRDVLFEIDGHTEAYSVTSAAQDVVALLAYLEDVAEEPEEESKVFLYGVSYGTYLVERVMHLAPPQVKGYLLDGVVSEQGFSALDWNANIMAPTRRFLEACFDSTKCPLRFKSRDTVVEEVLQMYDDIDAAGDENACAQGLTLILDDPTPSNGLRLLFGLLVRDPTWRTLVPSVLFRLHRCNANDFNELELVSLALQQLLVQQYGGMPSRTQVSPFAGIAALLNKSKTKFMDSSPTSTMSTMLYLLITFSELWQLPMPDLDALNDDYLKGPFALNPNTLSAYCMVSGGFSQDANVSSTCDQLRAFLEQAGEDVSEIPRIETPFLYKHDQYWNTTATLPDHVGAIFLVGGLDFQTPSELGKAEYEALQSHNKMLVDFDNGGHGSGLLPTTVDDTTKCGPSILASFIQHDGDVTKVNTNCMAELPKLEFDDTAFKDLLNKVRSLVVGGTGGKKVRPSKSGV